MAHARRHSFSLALGLAAREYMYERRISICHILALTAVLAPLLVLFGLRFGLIGTLAQRLIEDPANREVTPAGSGRFDQAFFSDVESWPMVGFVIPNTRSIAASFAQLRNDGTGAALRGVAMVPSAAGDPLLGDAAAPADAGQIVLSAPAARSLGIAAGQIVEAVLTRQRQDRTETAQLPLTVVAVAPEAAANVPVAYVTLDLLVATENYRDGYAVPAYGWQGEPLPDGERRFPRFRLYAGSIYDVGALATKLDGLGIEVRTKSGEIETMQNLDQNLGQVFWLIALCGVSGYLASLAATLLASVERKRRDLSVLRLVGFSATGIVMFPVVQAVLTAILGGALAVGIYFGFAAALNVTFGDSLRAGEAICRLRPAHMAAALAATVLCATLAAAWAGMRAARLDPSDGIRDV